eukprot:Seg239.7 transcript_id=Seg239.7/GoldUCD/mRNA.D3Y31 product="hypothetical protein" protein_id=Seg239.7/GoldUCD/D3Y31
MAKEIELINSAMFQAFAVQGQATIYDPDELRNFCIRHGARTLFNNIYRAITEHRHSDQRKENNKYNVVSVIYHMCFAKSQKCNFLQKEHGSYLKLNHISQEGLDTERMIGHSVSSRTVSNEISRLAAQNSRAVDDELRQALENDWLVVGIIDDYTTIHTKRHPKDMNTSVANSMFTAVCRIFPDIKAVRTSSVTATHNPDGINIDALVKEITSLSSMHRLSQTYADTMPDWLKKTFFTAESERQRPMTDQYHHSENVRKMRCLDNLHLLEFTEQTLKSKDDFAKANSITVYES